MKNSYFQGNCEKYFLFFKITVSIKKKNCSTLSGFSNCLDFLKKLHRIFKQNIHMVHDSQNFDLSKSKLQLKTSLQLT
jgi:hypothetical protein